MKCIAAGLIGLCFAGAFSVQAAQEQLHATEQYALKVGQIFILSLDSNHTTGYRWVIMNDESAAISNEESNRASAIKYSSQYIKPVTKGHVMGASGKEEFKFTAYKPGSVLIKMDYRRTFEPASVAAIKSKVLELTVK